MKPQIDLVFRNTTKNTLFPKVFFENIVIVALRELEITKPIVELSISVVGTTRIASLNKRYRDKHTPTDVLSFPLQNTPQPLSTITHTPNNAILPLGDIFICLPLAQKDAAHEGVGTANKLRFLTVHGLLHLLSYDHERSAKDEKKMFALQDKILKKLYLNIQST